MTRILRLFLLILLSLNAQIAGAADMPAPPGQVAVFPSMFELKIGSKPVNESIRLKNLKKDPVSIKIEVYNWTLDEKNALKTLPADTQSLDQWMVINPLTFTIEPGNEQVIRFSIRPGNLPNPGEHRAIIYFVEQPLLTSNNAPFQVRFKLGVGVYGYADPIKRAAVLNSITCDKSSGTLKVDIQNNGNVHTRLKGNYALWKKGTFPGFKAMNAVTNGPKEGKMPDGFLFSGAMDNTPILAGSRRTINTAFILPEEKTGYMVTIQGTLDGTIIEKVFP